MTDIWEEYEDENCWSSKRREPSEYCWILVINGFQKWYWMIVHEKMFCKVERNRWGEVIGYQPCKLTRTRMHVGRSILAEDAIII